MGGVPRSVTYLLGHPGGSASRRTGLTLSGDAISVDLLLRHGASIHATDNSGLTPLHWAAVKGSRACIRYLLEAGSDLDVKEAQGKTARDMAEELKGLAPFQKALEEAGYHADGRRRYAKLSEVSWVQA